MRLASPPARNSRARHARFRGEKTANVALMSDRSRGRRTGRRGCCGVDARLHRMLQGGQFQPIASEGRVCTLQRDALEVVVRIIVYSAVKLY